MTYRAGALAALLTTLMGGVAIAGQVLVADEGGGTLSRIDPGANTASRIEIGIAPHNVDLTKDGSTVLAVGMPAGGHSGHAAGGQLVTVPVLADGAVGPPKMVGIGGHPAHVVPDRSGQFAFVTDAETNSVLVVDLSRGHVTAKVAVGAYPHGLRLSPDGRTIAVANMKAGTVTLIDTDSRKKIADIPVGRSPVQVAFDPEGKRLFVSLNGENKVAAVDLQSRSVLRKAEVGRGPVQLAVTPDGRVVVANQGNAKEPDNRVSVINAANGELIRMITVGRGAHGVALGRGGEEAYVTNTYENSVSIVDLKALKEVARRPTGLGPNGVVAE